MKLTELVRQENITDHTVEISITFKTENQNIIRYIVIVTNGCNYCYFEIFNKNFEWVKLFSYCHINQLNCEPINYFSSIPIKKNLCSTRECNMIKYLKKVFNNII